MASTCTDVVCVARQVEVKFAGPVACADPAERCRALWRSAVRGRAGQGRGDRRVQARPEHLSALPRLAEAAAQGQHRQRPGVVGLRHHPVRHIRLLPDGLGHRPGHHQHAAAAGVPRRPDRRRLRTGARQLHDLPGRPRHRQPLRRARRQPGELDRQHGRARADPGVLHRRRGVSVRQPLPDEPRDLRLPLRPGAAHPPARTAGLLHDRAGRERQDPDRQPRRHRRRSR